MTQRIAHLTTVHRPRDNRIFNKECCALAADGLDVTLIATDAGTEDVDGVHMVELPRVKGRAQRLVLAQVNAWRKLQQVKPDLLHIHDPELIPLGIAWKLLHRNKLVFDSHEILVDQVADKSYLNPVMKVVVRNYARFLLNSASRFCDGIVAATPVIGKQFANDHIQVVENYPWVREYGVPDGTSGVPGRVIYAGGLVKPRYIETIVRAVQQVPEAHLVLAGWPDARTKELLESVEDDPRIDYRGVVETRDVPALVATGSIGTVLFPNLAHYAESVPTKMFEYMAAGIPFVASDMAHWRRLLDGQDVCLFVDPNDVDEVAEAIRTLVKDDELRHRLGRNGRRAVETRFAFEKEAEGLAAFIRQLLAS